jgi:hypothetical protein
VTELIRIPLTDYHRTQLAAIGEQEKAIQARRTLIIETIMGGTLPVGHPAWTSGHCEITNTELVIALPEPEPA